MLFILCIQINYIIGQKEEKITSYIYRPPQHIKRTKRKKYQQNMPAE
jgi:hypothetical protein